VRGNQVQVMLGSEIVGGAEPLTAAHREMSHKRKRRLTEQLFDVAPVSARARRRPAARPKSRAN
jgi:hypothetical protein